MSLETLRLYGKKIPLVSYVTKAASRERDRGHFVAGPVTLALGIILALLLFPQKAAAAAIYALAFGDGLASLVGTAFGGRKPAWLRGKSVEGCAACFSAVFLSTWCVYFDITRALAVSLTALAIEAMPLGDADNVIIPVMLGAVLLL